MKFGEGAIYEGRFRHDHFEGHGTIKVLKVVPGATEDEIFIPINVQSDFMRIHWKAGFGPDSH